MHTLKFVFSQLVEFLDRNHFNYLVRKYGGDKYVKSFTCWNQLLVMMFGQLSKSAKDYPDTLRRVVYWDEEQEREFVFLTNATDISALQVALLYKNRWQIELFFKWLKQHLKIKRFWGTTENAVRIQIYCAIIAYCLVAIVQHDMKLDRTVYETLPILSISLTDKTPLADLFDKTNFKNVKERSGLYDGPSLFENFKF